MSSSDGSWPSSMFSSSSLPFALVVFATLGERRCNRRSIWSAKSRIILSMGSMPGTHRLTVLIAARRVTDSVLADQLLRRKYNHQHDCHTWVGRQIQQDT